MPKYQRTLVRLFLNGERVANIYVDDWEDNAGRARFSLPSDHPRSKWFMDNVLGLTVLVMSTDEVEWIIDRVTSGRLRNYAWPHPDWLRQYHVIELTSRTQTLRNTQPEDWRCVQLFGVEDGR